MNTKNRFIIILGIFLLIFTACEKDKIEIIETGSITGVIFDSDTDQPIKGVSITTNPPTSSILTDELGKFTIDEATAGDVTITAKKHLYSTSNTTVLVNANNATTVEITLQKSDDFYTNVKINNPIPNNESKNLNVNCNLCWCVEKDQDCDSLKFNIIQYESNSVEQKLIAKGICDTTYALTNLRFNTTYYWQVIGMKNNIEVSRSETWSFSTMELPDYPYIYSRIVDNSYELIYSDTVAENQILLTNNISSFDWCPRVNPDRSKIAFTSNRNGAPHIYIIDRNGENIKKITSTYPNIGYFNMGEGFCWGPNGQYLLYGNYHKLFKIDCNTLEMSLIATAPTDRNYKTVDWNGVTNKIVVQTIGENIYDSEIYIMDDDGSDKKKIISNLPGRIESPSFSIDGSEIIYTRDIDGFNSETGRQLNSHIFIYDVENKTSTDLSSEKTSGTNDLQCRFSPTGAEIIFVNTPNTGTGINEIWKMDIDGSNRELLIIDGEMPDWI